MRQILIANILVYLRYVLLKNRLSTLQKYYEKDFMVWTNICQILLGYLITKYYHGRRIQTIYFVFLASFISQCFLDALRLIYEPNFLIEPMKNSENPYIFTFFALSSVLVFLEYNLVCLFGIIDLAKIAQINSNMNITTIVLCFYLVSQQFIAAMFYDRLFLIIFQHAYQFMTVDFLALIGAVYTLWPLFKEEMREISAIDIRSKYQKVPIFKNFTQLQNSNLRWRHGS